MHSTLDWLEIRVVGCSSEIKIVVDLHHGRQRWRTSHSLSLCYACPGDVGGGGGDVGSDNDGDNDGDDGDVGGDDCGDNYGDIYIRMMMIVLELLADDVVHSKFDISGCRKSKHHQFSPRRSERRKPPCEVGTAVDSNA